VTVTAHRRRALMLRAGVVAGFALGTILAIGAPAMAAPTITATAVTLEAGGDQKAVTVSVTADTDGLNQVSIAAESLPSGVSCSAGCGAKFNVLPGGNATQTIYLKAAANTTEGSSTGSVRLDQSTPPAKADFQITVKPKAPTTVVQISGTVKDVSTGEKLSDVLVVIADGAGKTYQDTTDGSGAFSFKTGGSTQIQAGTIRVAVSKDGFSAPMKSYTVGAGQSKTDISIAMTPKNAPSQSAQPSVEPSVEQSVDPGAGASVDASQPADGTDLTSTSGDEQSGGLSWMMIIIGGVLVLLGIGAITLILMRRNNDDDDEDDEDDDVPVRRPQGPRVTTGYYGARPSADPTMVARSPMADSPTTVQRPGEYGARPQQGGWTGYGQDAQPTQYGGGAGTYGSPVAPTSGYAGGAGGYAPQSYGSPVAPTSSSQGYGQASGPAYGQTYGQASSPAYGQASGAGAHGQSSGAGAYGQSSGAGAYGQQSGYGQQPGGYGQPSNGYTPQGGYDQGAGYGGAPQQSGYGQSGYGAQGGYDQGGGHGGQAGGYDQGGYGQGQPGYGQSGYGAQGGYDQGGGYSGQASGYDQGGYGQAGGGYVPEQRSGSYDQGAHDQSTQRWSGSDSYGQSSNGYDDPAHRADRRLDWLDD
jgi:Carboxypeptidase regulatory-like domain